MSGCQQQLIVAPTVLKMYVWDELETMISGGERKTWSSVLVSRAVELWSTLRKYPDDERHQSLQWYAQRARLRGETK